MFDVLNKITVDAIISPISASERQLVCFHSLSAEPKDLLLLDLRDRERYLG